MCQCKCSQSRSCSCSQSCNNNNSVRHWSIVTSTPCPNTNNCCGCFCGCGCNGSTQSTYSFCFLKSYLEDVLGWENVVKPCSNYGSRCPIPLQGQSEGQAENKQFDLMGALSGLIGEENIEQLKKIVQNTKNSEQLKNFPPIDQNLNLQEFISQAIINNFDELEETKFE